jgi:hypothetical protein
MAENQQNAKREPLHKLRTDGSVRAAIWANTNQATQEEYRTVSFYRSYRDKSGEWRTSTSFRPQDLPGLMQLAEQAHDILHQEQSARQGRQQEEQPPQPEPDVDAGPEAEF